MSDKPISRGVIISLVAGVPLAVTAARAAASADVNKPPTPTTIVTPTPTILEIRAKYKYTDQAPAAANGRTCFTCKAFQPAVVVKAGSLPVPSKTANGKCPIVPGSISPSGWCTAWAATTVSPVQ